MEQQNQDQTAQAVNENAEMAKLFDYQLNDALAQFRNTINGMAQQGIPFPIVGTALMVSLAGSIATVAVMNGISHDDAQAQLAEGAEKMKAMLAKVYTEVEQQKAEAEQKAGDEPGWMNPDSLPVNGTSLDKA